MSDTFSSWYAAHPILEEFPRASHNLFHGTEIDRLLLLMILIVRVLYLDFGSNNKCVK